MSAFWTFSQSNVHVSFAIFCLTNDERGMFSFSLSRYLPLQVIAEMPLHLFYSESPRWIRSNRPAVPGMIVIMLPISVMVLPPISKLLVFPNGDRKRPSPNENTGATNLDAIHNGSWCYIILVMATCSEQVFRAERMTEANAGPGFRKPFSRIRSRRGHCRPLPKKRRTSLPMTAS